MNEKTENFNGLEIKYLFKERKYDCKYLIVIFSGFGATNNFTYDLRNALKDVYANVLWIKDDFNENCAYYYAVKNKRIDTIINDFILKKANEIGVLKENIILSGFSKGGSAAIYYGIKFDYNHIISTVPQLRIADYCRNVHKDVLHHIIGDKYEDDEFNSLNNIITDALNKDKNKNRNIYLLTSEADDQYEYHIKPYVNKFGKYTNFNMFISDSILVRAHNQVTSHHIQLILSWFYALINDVVPRFGFNLMQGDAKKTISTIDFEDTVSCLKKLNIEGKVIYPEGVALIRGVDFEEWGDVNYSLIFESKEEYKEFPIAKASRANLTREYYNGYYCCYDKAWFCTKAYSGLDLSDLKYGLYDFKIKINASKYKKSIILNLTTDILNMVSDENFEFFKDVKGNVKLNIKY